MTHRRETRSVYVANVGIGSAFPIRIQSMTTTPTDDVARTVQQIMQLEQAGCEIVRVTVQGKKEARACEQIKNELIKNRVQIPLVADIHFYPPAAILVADFVDKVRINPGNYLDKRATFKLLEYTDQQYSHELERLEENFIPLLEKCRKRKIPLRIGTNHGSLSDRIMNRYGDTPAGMVESALEYTRISIKHGFYDLIFSMKSSNTLVMVEAYRLLVKQLDEMGWHFPLHLGVTEAGSGLDGRIKSSFGIGALLSEGVGDTLRVSLTENPIEEISPCKILRSYSEKHSKFNDRFSKERRSFNGKGIHPDGTLGLRLLDSIPSISKRAKKSFQADFWITPSKEQENNAKRKGIVSFTPEEVVFISSVEQAEKEIGFPAAFVVLTPCNDPVSFVRKVAQIVEKKRGDFAILLLQSVDVDSLASIMEAAAVYGACFADNLIEGIVLEGRDSEMLTEVGFMMLQAARRRSVKTEFISCPGCGRTLFDLQSVTKKIQDRTGHLPGVKIAVMGCIVNGPGEMADADFGYVGSGKNKVDLYVGKTCVEKGIDHENAEEALVELIKKNGKWLDIQDVQPAK